MQLNDEKSENKSESEPIDKQKLAVKYMPLAYKIAASYSKNWAWLRDELESEAMLALVEAANHYDPAYNVQFISFAKIRINGALMTFRRKMTQSNSEMDQSPEYGEGDLQKKVWRHTKSTSNLNVDEVNEYLQKCDTASYHAGIEDNLAILEELQHYIRRLPKRHRAVISGFYIEGRDVNEIARECKCTTNRLRAIHREAVNMLLSGDEIPDVTRSRMRRHIHYQAGLPHRALMNDESVTEN